jgi:predicted nucleic acid-binding protein
LTAILIDTNVLLRRTQPSHPHHNLAVESVARLIERGDNVCYTPQIIAEFWCVATRPEANNGLGLSPAQASMEVAKIEAFLDLLPDTPFVYAEWKRLVSTHEVRGVRVHDARLVASMIVHGVNQALTFNISDFERFGVEALNPSTV